jgi:hypothetical protein
MTEKKSKAVMCVTHFVFFWARGSFRRRPLKQEPPEKDNKNKENLFRAETYQCPNGVSTDINTQ